MAQVKAIRARLTEYEEAHVAARNRLNAKMEEIRSNLETQEEWILDALEMYHRTVLANDDTRVTIPTPAGTLKSNAGRNKWVYEDDAAFQAWVMTNVPSAVVAHEETIDKNKAKAGLKDATISDGVLVLKDGTTVPGVKIVPPERTFSVVTDD